MKGNFPEPDSAHLVYTSADFPIDVSKARREIESPPSLLIFHNLRTCSSICAPAKKFATSPSKSRIYNIYIYKKSPGKVRMKLEKFAPLPAHTSGQSKPFTSSSRARQRSSKFTKVPASVFSFSLYAPRGYIRAGIRGRGRRTGGIESNYPGLPRGTARKSRGERSIAGCSASFGGSSALCICTCI